MTWQTIKALHRVVIFSLLAATYLLTYWTRRIRDWLPLLHFAYRTFQPLLLLEHSTICNKHRAGPAHILFWTCQHGTLVRVSQLWGTGVWLISMCLIFDVESSRKWGWASSRKGFLQATDINNIPNITPITWGTGVGDECGNDARVARCQGQAPALDFRVNSAHQGGGSAVCQDWRTLSK